MRIIEFTGATLGRVVASYEHTGRFDPSDRAAIIAAAAVLDAAAKAPPGVSLGHQYEYFENRHLIRWAVDDDVAVRELLERLVAAGVLLSMISQVSSPF